MKLTRQYKFVCFIVAAILLSALIFVCLPSPVADAILPEYYDTNCKGRDNDWWTEPYAYDISLVKATVKEWFDNDEYDWNKTSNSKLNQPVIIAVIDSGINAQHEMFLGKYDSNGNDVSMSGVGTYDVFYRDKITHNIVCRNTVDDNSNMTDVSGHGTHVAGIISILIHELDLEEYIKIIPIKAGSEAFTPNDTIEALEFAESNGADVINMSLGTDYDYTPEQVESLKNSKYGKKLTSVSQNALVVAASGNGALENDSANARKIGLNCDAVTNPKASFPALHPDVVGVMSYSQIKGEGVESTIDTDSKSIEMSLFSNYGSVYDVVAPGNLLLSSYKEYDQEIKDKVTGEITEIKHHDAKGSYLYMGGTSQATPVVSFTAALMMLQQRARKTPFYDPEVIINDAAYVRGMLQHTSSAIEDDVRQITAANSEDPTRVVDSNRKFTVLEPVKLLKDSRPREAKVSLMSDNQNQVYGSTTDFDFALAIYPVAEYNKGTVDWIVNDVLIEANGGFSKTLSLTEVGEYRVKAVWKISDKIIETEENTISISYITIDDEKINQFTPYLSYSAHSCIYGKPGEKYKLNLQNANILSAASKASIKWIIDDEQVGTGETCDFTPTDPRAYEVCAIIDGYKTEGTIFTVLDGILTATGELSQTVGSLSEVSFTFEKSNASAPGDIIWRRDAEQFATGVNVQYTPQNAGTHTIRAVWMFDENQPSIVKTIDVVVGYVEVSQDVLGTPGFVMTNAGGASVDSGEVGASYNLSAAVIANLDPAQAETIEWYVNGNLVHVGREYTFSSTEPGDYEISFKASGITSSSMSFHVAATGSGGGQGGNQGGGNQGSGSQGGNSGGSGGTGSDNQGGNAGSSEGMGDILGSIFGDDFNETDKIIVIAVAASIGTILLLSIIFGIIAMHRAKQRKAEEKEVRRRMRRRRR